MTEYEDNKAKGINPIGHAYQAEHMTRPERKGEEKHPLQVSDQITLRDLREAAIAAGALELAELLKP